MDYTVTEKNVRTPIKREISVIFLFSVIILILVGLHSANTPSNEEVNPRIVVIRIDDVQDYAFKDAQLYLLNYSKLNKLPLSLAIIPSYFGKDQDVVDAVKQAIISGSEVTVHGWEHENLSQYTLNEQKIRLLEAKDLLEKTLNIKSNVLVPPMFSYNDDTIKAMEETGYTLISGSSEFHERGWVSEKIQSIPATIELSDYSNNTWQIKSKNKIILELNASIEEHGYAIIVTHPQEFINDNKVNIEVAMKFEQILQDISEDFSFNTIEGLCNTLN